MRKFKIDKRRLIKSIAWAIIILVGLVMADVSLRSILQDREIFTLTFTNVGTALFLAFANISFSWARSLDEKLHRYHIQIINRNGFYSFLTGTLFVLASATTFVFNKIFPKNIAENTNALYHLLDKFKTILILLAGLFTILILVNFITTTIKLFITEYAMISEDGEEDSRKWVEDIKIGKI